ncbi:hypothetical protein KL86DPRO_60134 [uncultured delta proteobacterium]|uniref:HTH lysR-type domain-containing protein n=1 Tax=uncultured delta proteobacterium TaxID=34034 RepID=A0A212KF47_9DELT|nr:hypothetical protein KL86DPRO_60134 [uncultured delta proteobacterium]
MTFRQLEYICVLVETGSVSRAARRLCISQPALSRQIMLIEQELGTQILDRSKTPFKLTPTGQLYLDAANSILETRDALLRKIKPDTSMEDVLSLRAAPLYMSTVVSRLLARFKTEYPQMAFRLQETLLPVTDDAADLEEDITFRICALPLPADKYDYQPLFKERILLAIPASHPEAQAIREKAGQNLSDPTLPGIDLAWLRDCEFVVPQTSVRLLNITREMCRSAGFEPRLFEANSMLHSILPLLTTTNQVSLVPETSYNYPNYYLPHLHYYTVANSSVERTMVAAYKKGRRLSALERLFIIKSQEYLTE